MGSNTTALVLRTKETGLTATRKNTTRAAPKSTDHLRNTVLGFEDAMTNMAWDLVERVFETEKRKLLYGLLAVRQNAVIKPSDLVGQPKILSALALLESKSGTWSRGVGSYKVIGSGDNLLSYKLKNIDTGKTINATLRTIASRWRHTP